MNSLTQYLNTDLDLRSAEELTPLAGEFESRGLWQVHLAREEDGTWFAIVETNESYAEPNQNITKMLDVIEALAPETKDIWSRCAVRQFNIGYQCGNEAPPLTHELSSDVVGRMAATGASLRFTLYPEHDQVATEAQDPEPEDGPKAD